VQGRGEEVVVNGSGKRARSGAPAPPSQQQQQQQQQRQQRVGRRLQPAAAVLQKLGRSRGGGGMGGLPLPDGNEFCEELEQSQQVRAVCTDSVPDLPLKVGSCALICASAQPAFAQIFDRTCLFLLECCCI
jgi:hypothetical protein